jgi:hypothetical protein
MSTSGRLPAVVVALRLAMAFFGLPRRAFRRQGTD